MQSSSVVQVGAAGAGGRPRLQPPARMSPISQHARIPARYHSRIDAPDETMFSPGQAESLSARATPERFNRSSYVTLQFLIEWSFLNDA
jgi:hypothetical protein